MVNEEQLTALDLTLWLGSTDRAADFDFTNQSTISRRNNKVLKLFGIHLKRRNAELLLSGELLLLDLERNVHQIARLKSQKGLRLQVHTWLQQSPGITLPKGWKMNSPQANFVCRDPVSMVKNHILDACLATPSQIPHDRDGLFILELHQRPINLTLLNRTEGSQGELEVAFLSSLENGNLELKLMPFLPASCNEQAQQWHDQFLRAKNPNRQVGKPPRLSNHSGERFLVAYLTPEMRMTQPLTCQVYKQFEPYLYTEHLVVSAQHKNEPAILALIETLQQQIGH